MAITPEEIKTDYPLPVYNYKVDVAGSTIAFSEVSGLENTLETTTYKRSPKAGEVGVQTMYMPAQQSAINFSMRKGYVKGENIKELYDWLNSTQLNQISKKDVEVHLCDETGAPMVTWKVHNAFPTKLSAPSFDANSNDVAIESIDLMADGFTLQEN